MLYKKASDMKVDLKSTFSHIKQYFNLLSDKEDEQAVVEQVSAGVVFRGTNLWILMFAILIASLGLNVNSTAVIIGAMLISPLMGPIIGIGLSVGINDYDLLRRALKNYLVATLISVVTATVYFFISPLSEARSELLARTAPTLYDVLIAFCGGAAGVLALTTKSKGQVIPGVAIATALMPPLCTAGYGLATAQWSYFLGAFYLYFINSVFIALSTFFGVKLLRFHVRRDIAPERLQHGRRLITIVLIVTLIPAAIMTVNIVRQNIFDHNVQAFVNHELQKSGTQIIDRSIQHDTLRVVAVGRAISESELADARGRMADYGLKKYSLSIIQGTDNEGIAAQVNNLVAAADAENRWLEQRVADLEGQLAAYTHYDTLSLRVSAEATALFDAVDKVRIGLLDGSVTAIVTLHEGARLGTEDRDRLVAWLRTRSSTPGIDIIIR